MNRPPLESIYTLAAAAVKPDRHKNAIYSRQAMAIRQLCDRIDAALTTKGIEWFCPTCNLPLSRATCIGKNLTVREAK